MFVISEICRTTQSRDEAFRTSQLDAEGRKDKKHPNTRKLHEYPQRRSSFCGKAWGNGKNCPDAMDFASGWAGGVIGTLLLHPLDTLRTRQAVHGDALTQALRAIIRSEGIAALYSGVMSPCLFTGIWKGVTLFTHRQLQHLLARHRGFGDASQLTVLEVACCASVAGAVGGAVLAPAELVKSRSQICSEPHSSPFQKELNQ
ncbi:SLC25A48, partial [Symbiodinium sp. CCMP2456]